MVFVEVKTPGVCVSVPLLSSPALGALPILYHQAVSPLFVVAVLLHPAAKLDGVCFTPARPAAADSR
jgi:hypothetical protein